VVIAYPNLVTDRLDKAPKMSLDSIKLEAETGNYGPQENDPLKMSSPQPQVEQAAPQAAPQDGGSAQQDDPMEAVKRAIEQDANKK